MTLEAGFTKEEQESAIQLLMRADAACADRLHGVGLASYTTVHVYAPDSHVAVDQARKGVDSGGFLTTGCSTEEIESVAENLFVEGYYDDTEQAFEVVLVGFARRYCLASDSREVSWAVQSHMEFGDFEQVYQADDWLARYNEVKPRMILESRDRLEEIIEGAENRDRGYVHNPDVDRRVTDGLLHAWIAADETDDEEFAEEIREIEQRYRDSKQDHQ